MSYGIEVVDLPKVIAIHFQVDDLPKVIAIHFQVSYFAFTLVNLKTTRKLLFTKVDLLAKDFRKRKINANENN